MPDVADPRQQEAARFNTPDGTLPQPENLMVSADLGDPQTLIRECETISGGLFQQADAMDGESAFGIARPDFFRRAAAIAAAAARQLRKHHPVPKPAEPGPAPKVSAAARAENKS